MAWLKVEQSLRDHRKLGPLARGLGVGRPTAIGHLVLLWLWCLDNAPTGNLKGIDADILASVCHWEGKPNEFVDALAFAGFLDRSRKYPERLRIHDWKDYAGKLLESRTRHAVRQRTHRDRTRLPLYERDGGRCRYCGEEVPRAQFVVDHIIPLIHGGDNSEANLATSCPSCNTKKGGRTPEQADMVLRPSPNTSRHASPDAPEKTRVEESREEKSREEKSRNTPLGPPKGGRRRRRKDDGQPLSGKHQDKVHH